MVFQNYALYPHMTVEKNISYGLKNMKVPEKEIKEKVDWVIKILGLEEYRERKPKNLSGGQRQRVALGRAIVKNQKVFLMDEPLSNLDAKLRVSMIRTAAGKKIGYVPKADNVIFARLMDAGKFLFGRIVSKEKKGKWLKITIKVYLHE